MMTKFQVMKILHNLSMTPFPMFLRSKYKSRQSLLNQNQDFAEDPLLRAIKRYENHPSKKGIERNVEKSFF